MNFLKDNRKYLRTKVTKHCSSLSAQVSTLNVQQCTEAKLDLKNLRHKLEKANYDISKGIYLHVTDRSLLDDELQKCENYEDKIDSLHKALDGKIAALSVVDARPAGGAVGSSSMLANGIPMVGSQLKLPQLPLPEYSHAEGESLDRFISNFETIINKYALSSYERFVFLERQLRGEALLLIKSLQGDHQSYEAAKELLTKAFASPIIQKFEIIEKLTELNLSLDASCYSIK